MAKQTFSINFYCRPSKKDSKGLSHIEMSIVMNQERTYCTLDRKEKPEDFETAMKSSRENDIKRYCERQKTRVLLLKENMIDAGFAVSAGSLKECFMNGGVAEAYTLGELWDDAKKNKKRQMEIGDIKVDTLNRYDLARDAFYEATGFTPDSPAVKVELQHIYDYQYYLQEQKHLRQNTIYQYQYRCRLAFDFAFSRGKINTNPYISFKNRKGEKNEIVWLDESELKKIARKDFKCDRLNRVRDLFLFQCYSGLSYADLDGLVKDDFQENELGQIYIEKFRKKTNQRFVSVVLKEGRKILEKYDFSLPKISNTNYNLYLKEIQEMAGIKKSLHTHLARTTYICYLYEHKVDRERIAAIVGHARCETTLKYYAKLDKNAVFTELRNLDIADKDSSPRLKKFDKKNLNAPDKSTKSANRKK